MLRPILLLVLLLAAPGTRAAELRIAVAAPPFAADPHFYNGALDKGLALHLFSRLVEQTPDTKLEPGLALSWHARSDTLWEFRLRPGVTFSDGAPLTPDDIMFSLARAPTVPNTAASFAPLLRTVSRVESPDPQTLLIHTNRPHPNLPNDLANIAIVSRRAGEGATTADYNSGKAAIGSGPYKLVSFESRERIVLDRNPTYFGPAPAWDRVTMRVIPNPGSRTAALLAGDVDLIDQPSLTDLAKLREDSRISLSSVLGTRTVYIRLDRSRDKDVPFVTGPDGTPLATNPFNDLRVRQALSLAINRAALADRVMAGTAQPTGQWLKPGTYSHNPDIPVPPYDPERAKALLADAGYPNGFRMSLFGAIQGETLQAVASMWSRVGVRTTVEMLPNSTFSTRAARQDFPASGGSWGSNSGEAGYFLVNVITTNEKGAGPLNWGRYSNKALDALTERAMATIDDTAREALLREAERMAMDDLAVIPVYQLVNVWAFRKGIVYEPRADERMVAMSARPAP